MDKALPALSIVTRLSRDASYTQRVLRGLLKQSGAKLEWVIVAQGVLTPAHLACFEDAKDNNIDVLHVQARPNMALGALANMGVRAASGEFILLHDDDDGLRAGFISAAMKAYAQQNCVAVTCHAALIDETPSGERLSSVLSPGKGIVESQKLQSKNLITTNGLIYKKSVFDAVSGYPEDVDVAEDWLFNLDLIGQGKISILPYVYALVYRRQSVEAEHIDANTSNTFHLVMARKIREHYGVVDPKSPNFIRASLGMFKRVTDRMTYKLFNGFFPR